MAECKQCGREAKDAPPRGTHAKLCGDCRASHGQKVETFEEKAKTLVSYGRRLDEAIADVRQAALRHHDARERARLAIEDWQAACRRLSSASPGGSR